MQKGNLDSKEPVVIIQEVSHKGKPNSVRPRYERMSHPVTVTTFMWVTEFIEQRIWQLNTCTSPQINHVKPNL